MATVVVSVLFTTTAVSSLPPPHALRAAPATAVIHILVSIFPDDICASSISLGDSRGRAVSSPRVGTCAAAGGNWCAD
jgi:hypothetical protein